MANLLPENETYEFENRTYINPNVSLDEQTSFIDKLRATQAQNNQEINTDTYNLGTAVPSNLGGLTGGEGYWTSRYQTPQTEALAENLRSVAQAKALEDALANEQAKWKKRYNDAYNANKVRSANPSTTNPENPELPIDTNSDSDTTEMSLYMDGEYVPGKLYPVTDYVSDYQDANGDWWQVVAMDQGDVAFGPNAINAGKDQTNENVIEMNGKEYMYLDNVPNRDPAWYRVVRSAGPGTYSPYAGS